MKSSLVERVADALRPAVFPKCSILLGLSGGMDSVVLLHLLHALAPRFEWHISALHVHHGISPNADEWANFCAELCTHYGIPLYIEQVDIAPLRAAHGIEAAARKLRHAAFARQDCDFVALAQHADDQAETVLLQLLRGAGVKGVAAMPALSLPKRPLLKANNSFAQNRSFPLQGGGDVGANGLSGVNAAATLRPLLDISRSELLAYATQNALQWVEDESNADESYARNFLRHRVLPLLEQKFPSYRATLSRSAQNFAEAGALLDELAEQDAQDWEADTPLDITVLRMLPYSRRKNLLRYFLALCGAPMPQAVQLDDMLCQLCGAKENAAVCVEFGGWQVRRYQSKVYVFPVPDKFDAELVLSWNGEAELIWPPLNMSFSFTRMQGRGISLAKLQQAPVTLRLRSGGEALRPHVNAATRSLKNLLQEHRVPPWQRERLPLLYCGDDLVCIVGVAVAADFQASDTELGVVVA